MDITPTKVACWMMLAKMPIWKVRDRRREEQHDAGRIPDKIVEDEPEQGRVLGPVVLAADGDAPDGPGRLGTTWTGVVGGFRLPQKRVSSTLSLVIAAPGILMFGPQASMVSVGFQAEHVVVAGLDLLLAQRSCRHEHGERRGLRVERLLDFDLLPALADAGRARPARRSSHHHDLARLLAGGLQRGDGGDGEMRGMAEDQVDVGIGQELVGDDGAGVRGLPLHGRQRDDLTSGRRLHLLLEALLDVERVGVARIAQDLQHLALDRAVLAPSAGASPGRPATWPISTVPATEVRSNWCRGDLAVEDHPPGCRRPAPSRCRHDRVEVDRGHDDRVGLERMTSSSG